MEEWSRILIEDYCRKVQLVLGMAKGTVEKSIQGDC